MYAIIVINNQQFIVSKGNIITLQGNLGKVGDSINVDQVLFHSKGGVLIGNKSSVQVSAKIASVTRSEKVLVKTYKRRKRSRKQYGSRHYLTSIEITSVAVALK